MKSARTQARKLRLQSLGNKTSARNIAINAGVAVVPGTNEPLSGFQAAQEFASEAGYPVMLKAAMGGGGRGMRVARGCAQALFAAPCSTGLGEHACSEGQGSLGRALTSQDVCVLADIDLDQHVVWCASVMSTRRRKDTCQYNYVRVLDEPCL